MRGADVDLAVIGGDEQRRARREHVEQVADEPVGGTQLGVVELAEAALVGDLVDAVVVGVDERLAGVAAGRPTITGRFDGIRQPSGRTPRRWASLNADCSSSTLVTTGDGLAEERVERLQPARLDAPAGVAARGVHHRRTLSTSPATSTR